jgi:thiol-disulfide isomerase/thioredoxin/uncharacterized membrane protein YphA (DoxX/SURF4 family)
MAVLYLYLRLLLAAVFAIAAVGKLLDFEGSRKSALDFGSPVSLAGFLAILLPLTEIVVAVLLIDEGSAFYGSVGAVSMLAAFTLLMTFQKWKGSDAPCHCFGAVSNEPIGWTTIGRNLILLFVALAVVLAIEPRRGGSLFEYQLVFIIPLVTSAVAPVVVLLLISYANSLKRKAHELNAKLEGIEGVLDGQGLSRKSDMGHPEDGIPVGSPVPSLSAVSLETRERVLLTPKFSTGHHILVFVGPDCGPCAAMLPDLITLREEFRGIISVTLISEGDEDRNKEKFRDFLPRDVFVQSDKEVSSSFLAKWTPTAILLSNGRVASRVAAGELNIRKLFEAQRGRGAESDTFFTSNGIPRSRFKIGEELPSFSTYTIEGEVFRSDVFKGVGGLIVFTDASCKHCEIVADSVIESRKTLSGNFPEGFRFLFLNSGDATKLLNKGLGDCAAIDEGQMLGKRMGAFGVPSAILVDSDGRIASETAVGSIAIDALLGKFGGAGH